MTHDIDLKHLIPQPHYNTQSMLGFEVPGWLRNCWVLSISADPIELWAFNGIVQNEAW